MENETTIETILAELQETVEQGFPMSPATWMDRAAKLIALLQPLDERLVEAEMKVNNRTVELVKQDFSVAKAKTTVKSEQIWADYLTLKNQKERIVGLVQIAKRRAVLPEWD